jgi:hypothetical protein
MHTLQDKNYVILIMYNQLNEKTCLKCKVKFKSFSIKMYLFT